MRILILDPLSSVLLTSDAGLSFLFSRVWSTTVPFVDLSSSINTPHSFK
jgi:hypothetical protein